MYSFTRACGAVLSGLGWIVLIANPLLGALIGMAGATGPSLAYLSPQAFMVVCILGGLIAGILVGIPFIVAGQLLRIAVDSVNIQAAMLERLDELGKAAAPSDRGPSGRFAGLTGE